MNSQMRHNVAILILIALCVLVFWGIVGWSRSVHPLLRSLRRTPLTDMDALSGQQGQYVLVIDAGSSGTRMNAFKFVGGKGASDVISSSEIVLIPPDAAKDKIPKRRTETRRAYQRVETEPGLSEFSSNLQSIEEHVLQPLLEWAGAVVPRPAWHATPIFLFGTAGMRRLSKASQEDLIETCRSVLRRSGFKFQPSWVRVIRGVDEGIYGWAALNAIEGRLGSTNTLGALDLGGSSLEITYAVSNDSERENTYPVILGGNRYNVYTYSHRHAGLDDAFQRSIELLEQNSTSDSPIEHPCIHKGYQSNIRRTPLNGKTPSTSHVDVVGAPNEGLCDDLAQQVVKRIPPCSESDTHCVMSFKYPTFDGKFAAMSGFYVVNHFYSLDSTSSVRDLSAITDSFCALDWNQVKKKHGDELAVETYCFRGEYIEALLGNGLDLDDKKVILGYKSPGWPLGAALVHGFSPANTAGHANIDADKFVSIAVAIGIACCVLFVYFVSKARNYTVVSKLSKHVSNIQRKFGIKGTSSSRGPLSSKGSFAALSMEQGETFVGWRQASSGSTGSIALSRSQTFSRKLNSLDSSES